ncbi:integrase catalytic domain-containing protein [Trichonephila clavipes]|nr:integrase catalytic domain-containing protein [Trichonephila clavipes]
MGADCPKIDILIGSDNYGKILTGQVRQLKGGLTAVYPKLGWIVCGASNEIISDKYRTAPTLCASLAVHDFNISDLWSLEAIGILDANQNLSNPVVEEIARDQFLSSLTRKENDRYCVGLPRLGSSVELPSNYQVAEKRLFGITRKLRSGRTYEEYDGVFKEWLEEGVIEMVPDRELTSKGHYLPHHPVFKQDSVTTTIRPVFDASCKAGRSPSLNDFLVKGPNLIEDIPSILLRFREKYIDATSDILRILANRITKGR